MIKKISVADVSSDVAKLRSAAYNLRGDTNQTIDTIFNDVIMNGDAALINYTEKFDNTKAKSLRISEEDIRHAYRNVSKKQIQALKVMKKRVAQTERMLLKRLRGKRMQIMNDGIFLQKIVQPLSSVGCYVPGGNVCSPRQNRWS
jgi:histidinol dehydrogenase